MSPQRVWGTMLEKIPLNSIENHWKQVWNDIKIHVRQYREPLETSVKQHRDAQEYTKQAFVSLLFIIKCPREECRNTTDNPQNT